MGPVTSRGSDPVTTLVKNITKSTFYWQMWEWQSDGPHTTETISYMVIEKGHF
jgi:hypothetical protein